MTDMQSFTCENHHRGVAVDVMETIQDVRLWPIPNHPILFCPITSNANIMNLLYSTKKGAADCATPFNI